MPVRERLSTIRFTPALALLAITALGSGVAAAGSPLSDCLLEEGLVRIARVVAPDGRVVQARVVADDDGVPSAVVPVAPDGTALETVLDAARALPLDAPTWTIAASERAERVCAPIRLRQRAIDDETRIVVAAGLNYAAHADEAGGGDVFVFPKPVEPTPPYGTIAAPAGATLLDYEVELGFVLLDDVDLNEPRSREELLARSAFFVANDVTNREALIATASLFGGSTGFVEAKGQPGFLPAGPWLVHGTALFAALAACRAEGLGIGLDVDEGSGFRPRQEATTAAMILDFVPLLDRIAAESRANGPLTAMPVRREHGDRYYPIVLPGEEDGGLWLPSGSVILTGTPEGVAMSAPNPIAVTGRGLLRLRSPFEQFRREELERAASGGPGGYLAPGDRVRARIDGLGAQILRVAEPGSAPPAGPCNEALR